MKKFLEAKEAYDKAFTDFGVNPPPATYKEAFSAYRKLQRMGHADKGGDETKSKILGTFKSLIEKRFALDVKGLILATLKPKIEIAEVEVKEEKSEKPEVEVKEEKGEKKQENVAASQLATEADLEWLFSDPVAMKNLYDVHACRIQDRAYGFIFDSLKKPVPKELQSLLLTLLHDPVFIKYNYVKRNFLGELIESVSNFSQKKDLILKKAASQFSETHKLYFFVLYPDGFQDPNKDYSVPIENDLRWTLLRKGLDYHFASLENSKMKRFPDGDSLCSHIQFINYLFKHPYFENIQNKLIIPIEIALGKLPADSDKAKQLRETLAEIQQTVKTGLEKAVKYQGQCMIGRAIPSPDQPSTSTLLIQQTHQSLTTILQRRAALEAVNIQRSKSGAFFKGLLGALLAIPVGVAWCFTFGQAFEYKKVMKRSFFSTHTRVVLRKANDELNTSMAQLTK